MNTANIILYAPIALGCLLLASLIYSFRLRRENRRIKDQLTKATVSLARTRNRLTQLEEQHNSRQTFEKKLNQAELTTELQKPRLKVQQPSSKSTVPEKYSYIHSLASGGMSVDDIAQLLAISSHEAQQLISLSKLAQPSGKTARNKTLPSFKGTVGSTVRDENGESGEHGENGKKNGKVEIPAEAAAEQTDDANESQPSADVKKGSTSRSKTSSHLSQSSQSSQSAKSASSSPAKSTAQTRTRGALLSSASASVAVGE